jgi:predicted dehydrogenase
VVDVGAQRLGVAVVGLGVGGEHVTAYRARPDLFDVVLLCDPDPERRRVAEQVWPEARTTAALDEVWAAAEVDVISLCTPPFLHVEQTRAGLDAGKTVVCEKPIAGSLQAVDELVELERSSTGRVMPVFQYRFGHGVQRLRALQDAGIVGRAFTTTIDVSWRRGRSYYASPWRGQWSTEIGGLLSSHCVHALDVTTYVLGPPRRAFARLATRVNEIETEDCAAVSLELDDGSLVSLSGTLGSMDERSWHRFCFEHVTAESNTAPYSYTSDPWTFVGRNQSTQDRIDDCFATFEPLAEGYQRQFELMHAALRTGGELPVTLADARRSIELLSALYWSSQHGDEVPLPLEPDHPSYAGWQP